MSPRRVRDLEEAVALGGLVHLLDRALDHAGDGHLHVARVPVDLVRVDRNDGVQVLRHDVLGLLGGRPLDLDLHVEPAGPQDRGVDQVLAVGRADHDHVLQGLDAVELGEQLRDDRRLDVRADAGAARAEDRVHLVEEHDHGEAFLAALLRALEDLADLPLGLADVLVQQLGALHVQEVAAGVLPARALPHLVGEGLGDGLRDQRLAAAGRSVEQDALRRLELVLLEQLRVQERQLDRVADRFDLPLEPADVLVGDVGDLLEDELLDLFLREELRRHAGARVVQHRVARTDDGSQERAGEVGDVLLVAAADDDGPVGAEPVLHLHDLARAVGVEDLDDVEGVVQDHLRAGAELVGVEVGGGHHAHLPARGHDVDGPVIVAADENPERGGRLGELLDLFGEGLDPLLLVAQGVGELLVLTGCAGERLTRLDELLLEELDLPGGVGQAAAEEADLLLQEGDLRLQLVDLLLALLRLLASIRHRSSPPPKSSMVLAAS